MNLLMIIDKLNDDIMGIKIKSLNEDNERLKIVIVSYKNMIEEQRKKIKNSDEQD